MRAHKNRTKKYRPDQKRKVSNTIRVALNYVAILTPEEREVIMAPLREAVVALRHGFGCKDNWDLLTETGNVAMELSHLGICSDAPSVGILLSGVKALGRIAVRVNEGAGYATGDGELSLIHEMVDRHEIQLMFAATMDLTKAIRSYELSKQRARQGLIPSLSIKEAAEVLA